MTALSRHPVEVIAISRHPLRADSERVTPLQLDIHACDDDVYARLGSPDALLHLAWGGLPNYQSASHLDVELPRQMRFLDALAKGGLTHLIVAGTCAEYGLQAGALDERSATEPATCYGRAKDVLRQHAEHVCRRHGVALSWARLFYLYGEGQHATSLYAELMRAIERKDAAFEMSGGEQRRDFLPVELAADILVQLALRKAGAGVVNVCSGQPVSVRRMVETWLSSRDSRMRLNLGSVAYRDHESMSFWGDRQYLDSFLRA